MTDTLNSEAKEKPKLPIWVHLVCGWPFLMVFFGGAIGGAMGGLSYWANLTIYRSTLPSPVKVLAILASGGAAILAWLLIAVAIHHLWGK